MVQLLRSAVMLLSLFGMVNCGLASVIAWTDWTRSINDNGFTAFGTITTTTSTVNVTYNNPLDVGFFQDGTSGIDYFQNQGGGRDPNTSPFTSSVVENIPTAREMIALLYAGSQTLMFSEAIANPVFSYVSLNGNGYAFDQDFEILSFGDGSVNSAGYWGAGTSYKNVVDLGGGNFEYQLLGTGEPHGTIRFLGAFDQVSWRSLTNEYWNGFTVGIEGTAAEVFPQVPEPSTLAVWGILGVLGIAIQGNRFGWFNRHQRQGHIVR